MNVGETSSVSGLKSSVVREKPNVKPPTDEEGVYLHKDGKAKFVPVTTGLTGDTNIEIVKGLAAGDQIITGPFRALREIKDDAKVREQKEEKKDKDGEKEKA